MLINLMKGINYVCPHRPKFTHFISNYKNVFFFWPKVKFPVHIKPKVILIVLYNLIFKFSNSIKNRTAQRLRCCATNRKVAGSIPAGVIGIFH